MLRSMTLLAKRCSIFTIVSKGSQICRASQSDNKNYLVSFQAIKLFGLLSRNHQLNFTVNMSTFNDNSNTESVNKTKLIVNYLPQNMTDEEFFAMFSKCGAVSNCRIMRNVRTNYSFGYGFVDFETEEGAAQAVQTLNGIEIRNKKLKVSFSRPPSENIKDTNLYVANLPRTITEDQLDTIFSEYGTIIQKNILRDRSTGEPNGVAFVRFNTRNEAQEAISSLSGTTPEGCDRPLNIRIAEQQKKAERRNFSYISP